MIRKHMIFSGGVQSRGFRYTASKVARRLKLTGWVRNRRDGTVEAEIQGEERNVDGFVRKLKAIDSSISITDIQEEIIDLKEEDSFIVVQDVKES